MKAVVEAKFEAELKELAVIAGPETAARLGVPVGTVVRRIRFDDDGKPDETTHGRETP